MKIGRRYIVQFVGVVAILLTALACNKQKQIPDGELALIFRDAFLSNAYIRDNSLNLDSLRLYEPIFTKYGYTTADVQYTIGSFATRKSARLGDVVEQAIDLLETKGEELDFEVSILDTIDNIANRRTLRTIYQKPLFEMRKLSDSTKFVVRLPDLEIGEYDYEFDYLVDSLDKIRGSYFSTHWIEDSSEELKKGEKPKALRKSTSMLTRNDVTKFDESFKILDSTDVAVLTLARPNQPKGGTPHLTIKRLKVMKRLPKEQALDSLFHNLFKVRIFDDELLFTKQETQNSL